MKGNTMKNESHAPTDQAAPISSDDLRELLDTATPGPWELCAHLRLPNENGCTCGYRGVVYGRGDYAICQPGHDVTPGEECLDPARLPRDEEIANMRLVAIVPQLAAEVLSRRADLAAPSAHSRDRCGNCGAFGQKCYGNAPDGPDCEDWIGETDGRACCYACYGAAPSAPAEVEDGRPMNTDVFLRKLFEACEDHWDRCEAINEWLHRDWPAALEYLEGEA